MCASRTFLNHAVFLKLYADDTKILRTVDNDNSRAALQIDIDHLYRWTQN